MNAVLANYTIAMPEIVLAVGAMALLMLGVFQGDAAAKRLSWLSVLLLAVVAFLLIMKGGGAPTLAFNGLFVLDGFASYMKVLVLAGSAASIVMGLSYMKFERILRFEYPVLVLTATLGMMIMVSAASLLSLYLGLELQSLSLYVLASIQRDHSRSTEAGLKYFVLGALSSGMMLYGISLIYGFTGTIAFDSLTRILPEMVANNGVSLGLVFGLVFLLAGLAFKISAVPFHMWTPDVYEGAPTAITAFFAAAPKVAAMALLLRVLYDPLSALMPEWKQVLVFASVASMILGAVAAIAQTNIKRLMAYSSIGHVGYALIGIAAGTEAGIEGVILYMSIYLAMTVGSFLCIMAMRRHEGMVENIGELAGLVRSRPGLAVAFATFMISLIGFPPFAGFWGKLFIFQAAIDAHMYTLAVIGMVTSVIGAYYYLRIVKIIFFDEPAQHFEPMADRPSGWLLTATALVNSPLSFIAVFPLLPLIEHAARTLAG